MTNAPTVASNEAPKTSTPEETKPAPQQQSQNPSDKPADKKNEQQK